MAMTYSDAQISLEHNNWFTSRVRQALSIFSNYLLNTPQEDPAYNDKVNAGMRLANQVMMIMPTLMFTLTGDAEVQAAGPAIPDAQLQSIVEKTVVKFWPVTPAVPLMPAMPLSSELRPQ